MPPFSAAANFLLPNRGTLQIEVPSNWQSRLEQPPGELPPTIRLSDNRSLLLITPIWSTTGDAEFNDDGNIRKLIENDGKELIVTAVETELIINKFASQTINGYYFQLTDQNPKPGEFRFLCRSGVGVGELLLSVTYLSHQRDISDFLQIMNSISYLQ